MLVSESKSTSNSAVDQLMDSVSPYLEGNSETIDNQRIEALRQTLLALSKEVLLQTHFSLIEKQLEVFEQTEKVDPTGNFKKLTDLVTTLVLEKIELEKQKAQTDKPRAPEIYAERASEPGRLASPKGSVSPKQLTPPQKLFNMIQELDMDRPNYKEDLQAVSKELDTLKKGKHIDEKQALELGKILGLLRSEKTVYPRGLANACYKRLEQERPAVRITPNELNEMQKRALSLLKLALTRSDANIRLQKHCEKIIDEIHKAFDKKIKNVLGADFLKQYQTFVKSVETFKKQTEETIENFLILEGEDLSQGGKEEYQSIRETLTYLNLSEESQYLSTVTKDYIDSFGYSSLSLAEAEEAIASHTQKHLKDVSRQVKLNDWFLKNRAHVKKAYNQSIDPNLHGLVACNMIALRVVQQLKDNRSLPSEEIDFSLTSKMFASVQEEYQAEYEESSPEASKKVINSFKKHFTLEEKGILPIMTQKQMESSSIEPKRVLKDYQKKGLKTFTNIFKEHLPIQGKGEASTKDLAEILPSLKTLSGITHIALSSLSTKDKNGLGHDIILQLEPESKIFRYIDSNVGVIEFNNFKEFTKEISTLLPLLYPDYTAFMVIAYKD